LAVQNKDRQIEKLERSVSSAESRTAESELQCNQAAAALKDEETEAASLRQQLVQCQASLKHKDKEADRLLRILDGTKVSGVRMYDK
jgi:septal ring factor EnvC (AmiA/AmiB activator)